MVDGPAIRQQMGQASGSRLDRTGNSLQLVRQVPGKEATDTATGTAGGMGAGSAIGGDTSCSGEAADSPGETATKFITPWKQRTFSPIPAANPLETACSLA